METDPNLERADYLRRRLDPRPGDEHYLHMADLRRALEGVRHAEPRRILDFGCGGSPYRSLFAGAPYDRADLPGPSNLDYVIGADSRLPSAASGYDEVISTQVLEHVPTPETYLSECHRILRPGGRLVLTTHGTFYDHGSPYDYQRWTADGLRAQIERAGLRVLEVKKLTTGPRALMLFLETFQWTMLSSEWSWGGLYLRLLRLPFRCCPAAFHRFLDRAFPRHRVADATEPDHKFYVALLVIAERPSA